MNSSEKVFYGGNTKFSWKACNGIEHQSELIGWHIHHALCGHGGERFMVVNKEEILVDGFDSRTGTVYQFYGCKWDRYPCLGIVPYSHCSCLSPCPLIKIWRVRRRFADWQGERLHNSSYLRGRKGGSFQRASLFVV